MNKKIYLFLIAIAFLSSCMKNTIDKLENNEVSMENMNVSPNFDYKTTTQVDLSFQIKNDAIADVDQKTVAIFNPTTGNRIFKGKLDANGSLKAKLTIPTYLTEVSIISSIPGVNNFMKISIEKGQISFLSADAKKSTTLDLDEDCSTDPGQFRTQTMGGWGNAKVPNAGSLIYQYFDVAFPNGLTVGCAKSLTFTSAQAVVDFLPVGGTPVKLTKSYTDPVGKNLEGIGVFAGQLVALTVSVEFNKKQIYGFSGSYSYTLLGDLAITEGVFAGWTVSELLAEANVIIGSCECSSSNSYISDLSDALASINENFVDGVMDGGFLDCPSDGPDCDEDGVLDSQDEYPCDPEKTFNNYSNGTLVYEDLWPSKGDYDFNDLVVDYTYNKITNSDNKVTYLDAKFEVRAIGASFKNGLGFELNVDPEQITSVNGSSLTKGYITLNSNGTESGQTKAVIIVFDNAFSILPHPGTGQQFINTVQSEPYSAPQSTSVNLRFETPIAIDALGELPYNAFLIKNGNRDYEVHLADKKPTNLANTSIFGTEDDATNSQTGMYYKTAKYLPWALHLPEIIFDYPTEKTAIIKGYLKFKEWAESSGVDYPDWYINTDYRDENFIYQK